MLGFAEQLEFLASLRLPSTDRFIEAAAATCDYYITIAAADGIPYWDTGAPGLATLGDWGSRPADPFNDVEPVDSSAAAIAAQGLLRLGRYLTNARRGRLALRAGRPDRARHTVRRGGTVPQRVARTTGPAAALGLSSPERLGLTSRPARAMPRGESSMWGDYHAREAALYVQRLSAGRT